MKDNGALIKFLGYTLALLVFVVLLIEIYSMTTDLNKENFKAIVTNVKCSPKSKNLELYLEASYNGQRILKDFKVFLKLGNIVLKSNSTSLEHNETVILSIEVPIEYLRKAVYENTSLFLGFEFSYDGVVPLKIAFRDLEGVLKFEIEPLKVGYFIYDSKYNVTVRITIINPLPLKVHGKLVFTVLNYSKTLDVTLVPCGTIIINLPTVEISKEQLEKGVECSLNLVVNGKVASSRTISIKT